MRFQCCSAHFSLDTVVGARCVATEQKVVSTLNRADFLNVHTSTHECRDPCSIIPYDRNSVCKDHFVQKHKAVVSY